MDKEIVSLKNLYRLITERDYLIYSSGVLSAEAKSGLTVNKFWQTNIMPEFIDQKTGRMIWREEGSRNTYTSLFINRNDRFRRYEKYRDEVLFCINEEVVLGQVTIFSNFFITRKFNYEEFKKKIHEFCLPFNASDDPEVPNVKNKILLSDAEDSFFDRASDSEKAFHMAWKYTLLILCALCCSDPEDKVISKRFDELGINEMELLKRSFRKSRIVNATLCSSANNQICKNILEKEHFFGREEEVFNMIEKIKEGGKYLLSGIGGTGKTELLRQLYRYFITNGYYENIYAFQYKTDIAETFARGKDEFVNGSVDNAFTMLCKEIGSIDDEERYLKEKNKNLILIDNVDTDITEDKNFNKFMNLNATVVMSSRMKEMKGFETVSIPAPKADSCILIFRDNCERQLSKEEMDILKKLMKNDLFRHPLTLRLLGRIVSKNGWKMEELKERFEGKSIEKLNEVYSLMYNLNNLSEREAGFLGTISLIPAKQISLSYAAEFMFDETISEDEAFNVVSGLSDKGWVNVTNGEFVSIHPYVAECITKEKTAVSLHLVERAKEFFFGKYVSQSEIVNRLIDIAKSEKGIFLAEITASYIEVNRIKLDRDTYALALYCMDVLQNMYGGDPRISERQLALRRRSVEHTLIHDILYVGGLSVSYASEYLEYTKSAIDKGIKTGIYTGKISDYLYNAYGELLYHTGKIKESLEVYEALAEEATDYDILVRTHGMLGVLNFVSGVEDYKKHYDYAIKIAEWHMDELKNKKYYAEVLLNSITYKIQNKELDGSLEIIEKAESFIDPNDISFMTELYSARATVENALGLYDAAEEDIKKTAEFVLYLNGRDSVDYALTQSEYGKLKIFTKEYDQAIELFDRAIPVLRKVPGREPFFAVTMGNKATACLRSGRYEEAWAANEEASPVAEKLGSYYKTKTEELRTEIMKKLKEKAQNAND